MIRQSNQDDIERAFDRHIKAHTGLELSQLSPDKFITVEQDGLILCAMIYRLAEDAEVHIMCPRESARKSRDLCREVIQVLKESGVKRVYTSTTGNNKRADNLVKKLGFAEIRAGVYLLEV